MKKFIDLIKRIHQEKFSTVANKIVAEKIPTTFLSVFPMVKSIEVVKNLRNQGLNITNLITTTPTPYILTNLNLTL